MVGLLLAICLSPGAQTVDMNAPPEGTVKIIGGDSSGNTGHIIRNIGDFNGDGLPELAIASPFADTVYVVLGKRKFPKVVNLSNLGPNGFIIVGPPGSGFGTSVVGVKDVNRDGRADVAVGAPYQGAGGRVYVIGGISALPPVIDVADESVPLLVVEGAPGEQLGLFLGGGEKFDGDASSDLFLPSPFYLSPDRGLLGAAYIIYGQRTFPEKIINTQSLDPESTLTILNDSETLGQNVSNFGLHFKPVGDVLQNGSSDLVLYAGVNSSEPGSSALFIIPAGDRLAGRIGIEELPEARRKVTFQLFSISDRHEIGSILGCDLNRDGKIELAAGMVNAGLDGDDDFYGAVGVVFVSHFESQDILIDQFEEPGKDFFLFSPEKRALYGFDLTCSETMLFTGAPYLSNPAIPSAKNQGGVVVIVADGAGDTAASSLNLFGRNEGDNFGVSIDFLGDLNKDGIGELLVGVHEKPDNVEIPAVAYIIPIQPAPVSVRDFMLY